MHVVSGKIEGGKESISRAHLFLSNSIIGVSNMTSENLSNNHQISKTCTFEGCSNQHLAKGFCNLHYKRFRTYGNPAVRFPPKTKPICITEGCDKIAEGRKKCRKHYIEDYIATNPNCIYEGCNDKSFCHQYCIKHYSRYRKYGDASITKINAGEGKTSEERFWSKVDKTANPNGCWEWQGVIKRGGYGGFKYHQKAWIAHRLAYFLTFHKMPKLILLHICDNPICVNPEHLREGTHQDNSTDMVCKNRQAKGEKQGSAKLSNAQVEEIKRLGKQTKLRHADIASRYGVARSTVSRIIRGVGWKHIEV